MQICFNLHILFPALSIQSFTIQLLKKYEYMNIPNVLIFSEIYVHV